MDNNFLEYCINQSLFTNEELRNVISHMTPGMSIYEMLTRMNVVDETQLAVAAGEFYDCPVVDILRVSPDPKATLYGSAAECRKYSFIPFAVDPVVGVLIALVDYSLLGNIRTYLKSAHVERMKFYIAPCSSLNQMLDNIYGQYSAPEPEVRRPRPQSILRTQSVDFDFSGIRKGDSSPNMNAAQTSDARRLQAMAFELAACREENSVLKQRIEQLSSAVELESSMIRELAKVLKTTGALDASSFERWISALR